MAECGDEIGKAAARECVALDAVAQCRSQRADCSLGLLGLDIERARQIGGSCAAKDVQDLHFDVPIAVNLSGAD